jgi:hypothetical protein
MKIAAFTFFTKLFSAVIMSEVFRSHRERNTQAKEPYDHSELARPFGARKRLYF